MKNILIIRKGLLIGGSMIIPGVSGGSMAMILGIYDKLITSVSSFMKHKRESFQFLLLVMAGGVLGIFLFSKPLLYLMENHPYPTLYGFMGAVIGGVPLIFGKAQVKKFTWNSLFYVVAGAIIVLAISFLPLDTAKESTQTGMQGILLLILAGFIAAVALILPGISGSYLLLLLGLYNMTMEALSEVYLPYLIPLGVGILLGVILTAKVLEKAMTLFPRPTYLMILGFVLGSLPEVCPGVPKGHEIILCIITFLAGFFAILYLSKKEA